MPLRPATIAAEFPILTVLRPRAPGVAEVGLDSVALQA